MKKLCHPYPWMKIKNCGLTKPIVMMKLIVLFIAVNSYMLFAKTNAQSISINVRQASLKAVLKEIEQQSGYTVWYKSNILDKAGRVSIDLKNVPLKDALDKCFDQQPFTFEITDNMILIKKKEQSIIEKISSFINRVTVTGKVIDEQGNAIPGVNIAVKGTNTITTSDNTGRYTIEADENSTLVFTFVGYDVQEIPVQNRKKIDIRLKASDNKLDQVQVIGYGKTTRRLTTGNLSSVKAEEFQKQPVTNPILALQGRVPGLVITQSNGIPGSGLTVRIQGQNSIQSGGEPFYVIDGVPFNGAGLRGISGSLGQEGANPLGFINPASIESIEVLKDADATAIYGSKAANGAILITTKKGKAGESKVDVNFQQGVGRVSHKMPLLNTDQYLQLRRDALKNDGINVPAATDYDLNGTWNINRYTDWQKELIGGTAGFTNAQASVSGGSLGTQFNIGGGFSREGNVFPGNFSDKKSSVQFSVNHQSNNKRFRVRLSGNYLNDVNNLLLVDLTDQAITLPPNAPEVYTAEGELNWQPLSNGNSSWTNPLAQLFRGYLNRSNNLVSSSTLAYELLPRLVLKADVGYNKFESKEYAPLPPWAFPKENQATFVRRSTFSDKSTTSWILEPQLSYSIQKPIGGFDFIVGSSFQKNDSFVQVLNASGFTNDSQMNNIQAATAISATLSTISTYKYNALFGRISYNLKNKYLVNFNARRDGSSRFGSQNLFNNFYSVGAAWIFSEEKFLQNYKDLLSFGKLKISYGTTGNDQIPDYSFLSLYSPLTVGVPYQGGASLQINGLTNPYIQWEETRKFNLGIDLGFLNNCFLFNANYYVNRSSNQLLTQALPFTTGFSTIAANLPATVQNSGIEFALNAKVISAQSFTWQIDGNFSIVRNKLLKFDDFENSAYRNSYRIGEPIGISKRYQLIGVDPNTGLYQFATEAGGITTTPISGTDNFVFVTNAPTFYAGLNNQFAYKQFSLDFLFQFTKQKKLSSALGSSLGARINQPEWVMDYWKNVGDETLVRKPSASSVNTNRTNGQDSDYAFSDASFLRLRNVSLSYSLPETVSKKIGMQNCRVFLQGQNLLTFTGYKGMDPETGNSLPVLRVMTMGVNLTF